ncbi:MAG: two-component histidine kinase [Gemmatimonadetes bacterium]|nr:two-component histidine kinase [Gemmatimonadota bacterium]
MASIRMRLTAWNGGVLVFVLCLLAASAYAFLRYATLAQVDRALEQQVRLVVLTARAQPHGGGNDDMAALIKDLEDHGIVATRAGDMPDTFLTTPVRLEENDELHPTPWKESPGLPDIDRADLRAKLSMRRDDEEAFSVRGRHGGLRALVERVPLGPRTLTVIATQPLHATAELLETARVAALVALPIVVLLALITGYLLARGALDPIAAMTSEARRIGARTLHERLSIRNPHDELGQLALTFNEVLERVDDAMEQQRRFTADASHELRTPIALIRAEADVALAGSAASEDEYRSALGVIRDGSQQLSRIVNDLFLLARADAGQTLISPQSIDLAETVTSAAYSMRSLADAAGVTLNVEVPPDAPYHGDEELLRRALVNLLDNAIKYSVAPGNVDVVLARTETEYRISVTDDGPGISPDDQSHIFDRFYRGDSSRTHNETANGAGAGLGLAIAREIAELHGGCLELRRSNSFGSSFELLFPGQRPAVTAGSFSLLTIERKAP